MMLISKYGNGTEELVREFEIRHCIELDDEYRKLLVKYNGGDTPKTGIKSKEVSSDVRCFFGLNTEESIEDVMQNSVWLNKKYIPIGKDSFGNYYAIGISEPEKGNVFFCDHENGFRMNKIADSFSQFLKKCKSEEINSLARSTPEEREKKLIENGKAGNITDGLRKMWKQEYEKYKDMVQEKVIL